MVAAIKQSVTVADDGTITVRDPQLKPGTQAEVIVLVEQAQPAASQLEAFLALQSSMNLDRAAVEKWASDNRQLRQWTRPNP